MQFYTPLHAPLEIVQIPQHDENLFLKEPLSLKTVVRCLSSAVKLSASRMAFALHTRVLRMPLHSYGGW